MASDIDTLIPAALRDAAAMIREKGWCQGRAIGKQGEVCLSWAVCRANPRTVILAREVVRDELARRGVPGNWQSPVYKTAKDKPPETISLARWNDEPGRTKEEVLEVLEAAAESAGFSETLV